MSESAYNSCKWLKVNVKPKLESFDIPIKKIHLEYCGHKNRISCVKMKQLHYYCIKWKYFWVNFLSIVHAINIQGKTCPSFDWTVINYTSNNVFVFYIIHVHVYYTLHFLDYIMNFFRSYNIELYIFTLGLTKY